MKYLEFPHLSFYKGYIDGDFGSDLTSPSFYKYISVFVRFELLPILYNNDIYVYSTISYILYRLIQNGP